MKTEKKKEDAWKEYTIDNETFLVQNECQSEFLRKVTEFCTARNDLERFLADHQMYEIDANRVSGDCYEKVILYSELCPFNFLKAEPNLQAVKWVKKP